MDSYLTFRIFMGFIGSTLAIILGFVGFFMTLREGCFVWQPLALAGCGVLGEFICYAMCKNSSKKDQDNKNNGDKGQDNEKN